MDDAYKLEPGPILVLAGPGTGKTHTIAQRARYLIENKGVSKDEVTIIAFTKAATFETRARLSHKSKEEKEGKEIKGSVYLPPVKHPKICTMHSLGYQIVDENLRKGEVKLTKGFYVIDQDDDKLMRDLIGDAAQLNGKQREFAKDVKDCRDKNPCQEDDSDICKVCKTYREMLRISNGVDYNELIRLACVLLKKYPNVSEKWQQKTRHLLVDEYQDINASQYEMIRLLTEGQERGLFVVGDDDQSIYSWRGGSPGHIRNFEKDFKGLSPQVVPIAISWRCPESIHEGALSIIKVYDTNRRAEKGINQYLNKHNTKITVRGWASEKREAREIAKIVKDYFPEKDFLILIPKWEYAKPIKQALQNVRLPYDLPIRLKETNFAIFENIATWLENENKNLVLRNMIGIILDSKIGKPNANWKPENVVEWNRKMNIISNLWKPVLKSESSLMDTLKNTAESDNIQGQLVKILQQIADSKAASTELIYNVCNNLNLWKGKAEGFIKEIRYWCENARITGNGKEKIRILTRNKAKGLSADIVFVVGLEDEVSPGNASGEELKELSRLLYVSMTRAKEELYLFWARKRGAEYTHIPLPGNKTLSKSRFIDRIPDQYLDDLEVWR